MSSVENLASQAESLSGPDFQQFHRTLAAFNHSRLDPALPAATIRDELQAEAEVSLAECLYIEAVRRELGPLVRDVPKEPNAFIQWFESLENAGPGQHDELFPWLEREASSSDLNWFLLQEVAGEAGFEDLLAMTQIKMPTRPKLEMARNFWDEMGRGRETAMHGGLLDRLAAHLDLRPNHEMVVPEALALGNAMIALARHRRYAFHSVGALGAIEMTAPARAGAVNKGLKRLRVPTRKRLYFAVHAVLDVRHSEEWNREVLRPLVEEDPSRAQAIAEGALIRLWHGQRCFKRYRRELGCVVRSEAA